MTRYLRLYAYFLRFSFSRAMEFRFDFFFRVVMDCVWYGVNLAFFRVLFLHTPLLGGWSDAQVLVFLATLFLQDALHMAILANNMWHMPDKINRGELDYMLVRPVSPLFFISLRDFAANSFVNVLIAGGFLAWVLARHPDPLPALNLGLYFFALWGGLLVHYLCELIFLIPVFWMQQGQGLRQVMWSLNRYSQYPDGIFTGWGRRLLTTLLPLALIASYPTRVLLDPDPWPLAGHMAAVILAFGAVTALAWTRGLKAYASASS